MTTKRITRRRFLVGAGALVVGFSLAAPPASKFYSRIRGHGQYQPPPPVTVDAWLTIDQATQITVYTGKVDLGTGIATALLQIVAEELEVRMDQVALVQGDTEQVPDQSGTWASTSISQGGSQLRLAAATARQALLNLAAKLFDVVSEQLNVEAGVIRVKGNSGQQVSYGELVAERQLEVKLDPNAPFKAPGDYRLVGSSVPRIDIPAKVQGEFSYVHDLRLPGMLHGRILRPSPGAGTRLGAIDTDPVKTMPGLVKIVQKRNFIGVVAEEEWQAVQAAQALDVTWEQPANLPAQADLYEVIKTTDGTIESRQAALYSVKERLLANQSDPVAVVQTMRQGLQGTQDQVLDNRGDVSTALTGATETLQAGYTWPFQAHAPIGPSCAIADVQPNQATIWSGSQYTHGLRRELAHILAIPEPNIHIIYQSASGCYGRLAADDAAVDAALLSQAVGQPVRVQWSRQDEHSWAFMGPAMVAELQGALDDQGNLIAWNYEFWSPNHFVPPLLVDQLDGWTRRVGFDSGNIPNFYKIPNRHLLLHMQPAAVFRHGNLRALAAPAATFAAESFIDELAAVAQADPVEFRLRYLAEERAKAVLQAAAEGAGWETRPSPQQPHTDQGRGVALAKYGDTWVATVAEVTLNRETAQLHVTRMTVAHDCGLIINPDGLTNQIEGNVIQSLSRTLKEEVQFDTAITSRDWASYPILTFAEIPEIDAILINRPDISPSGAGEPATVPTAAAVANALFDATGVRLRTVPFTPERIQAALQNAPSTG